MNVAKYAKAITAVAGALSIAVADGIFDVNDGFTVVLALLAAVGVYAVPNATDETA